MKSIAELEAIKKKVLDNVNLRKEREEGVRVVVGMATCGIAAGARPVMTAFTEENLDSQMKNKCLKAMDNLCSYFVLSGQNPDKADSELRSEKILRNHYLSPLRHFWFSEWE